MNHAFKIQGLPRTCTNLSEKILKLNFPSVRVLINRPWSKHHGVPSSVEHEGMQMTFIICTKHPVTWLWSYWKHVAHHYRGDRNQFLKGTAYHYHHHAEHWTRPQRSPIDVYNVLCPLWLDAYPNRSIVIRQETMNEAGQIKFAQRAGWMVDVKPTGNTISQRVMPRAVISDETYSGRTHRFTDDEMRYIEDHIDWSVAARLGYQGAAHADDRAESRDVGRDVEHP